MSQLPAHPVRESENNSFFTSAHHFSMDCPQFNNYDHSTKYDYSTTNINIGKDVKQKLKEELEFVKDAGIDDDKVCFPDTRTEIVKEISDWIRQEDINTSRKFILCGEAGTGKSAIAHTVGQKFKKLGFLVAFFAFNRSFLKDRTPSNALRTIAYTLGVGDHDFAEGLLKAFDQDPFVAHSSSIEGQWENLIVAPAQRVDPSKHVVIILDALDESGPQKPDGPRDRTLATKAEGYFQWASTVCKALSGDGKGGSSVQKNFQKFMSTAPGNHKDLSPLDSLYMTILEECFDWRIQEVMEGYKNVMAIILAAFEPLTRTSLKKLQLMGCKHCNMELNGEEMETVVAVICYLGSLFTGVDYLDTPIKPVHTSIHDFLLDETRSRMFAVNIAQGHNILAWGSLQLMINDLHFNMCDLESSYVFNSQVRDLKAKIAKGIPHQIEYASCFWDQHLYQIQSTNSLLLLLEEFWFRSSIFWLEVLSLLQKVHVVSRAIENVRKWIQVADEANETIVQKTIHHRSKAVVKVKKWLQKQKGKGGVFKASNQKAEGRNFETLLDEVQQFVRVFGRAITDSTPHLYLSAIPFIPKESTLQQVYSQHTTRIASVCNGHKTKWSYQQAILIGHTGYVKSVAFSPDGRRIVSGSDDHSVQVWDAESGKAVGNPMKAYAGQFKSVAFSPDGQRIVSGSDDGSVLVWDAESGKAVGKPMKGHTDQVNSVAFSPDGRRIVSGSSEHSVQVWDAESGKQWEPMKGHTGWVNSLHSPQMAKGLCPDPLTFSAGLDAESGKAVGNPMKGHTGWVNSVAFSPDGRRIVSGSSDHSVRVWVAFSPDGRMIVSGSDDHSVQFWDAESVLSPCSPDRSGGKSIANRSWESTDVDRSMTWVGPLK
ncbi:WD40 repeat-like protein [Gymnopus androsaceus JB14]|uniref:WD40 repeat-like protein n=1 Tax=Gymnopus androsaceus JB14 TaxID=1447944 RepID=A0A6A4HT42_9AGAR|nr:WD40 repeat-like protein [Gymnopus androsaceus JB14]